MPGRLNIQQVVDRAIAVQPPNTKIISLKMMLNSQWVAVYIMNEPPVMEHERTCYRTLECPLFSYDEI